jgi:hypothetical protein
VSAEERPEPQSAPSAEAGPGAPGEGGAVSAPEPAELPSATSAPAAEPIVPSAAAEPTSAGASAADAGRPGVPAVAGVRDDLTADALLALLRATFAAGRTLHWSACLDTLGPISAGLPTDLTGWTEGRAWGAGAEVRWQPAGDARFSALYLGEGDALPEGFQALATDLRAVPGAEPDGLFLWGTRGADGEYREPRLPRLLDYAALGASAPQARLPCRLIVDAAGQVRFVRLMLEEATG